MKICPKCKKQWPDTGKFCPMDGTPLVQEGDDEIEQRPTVLLRPEEVAGRAEEGLKGGGVEALEGGGREKEGEVLGAQGREGAGSGGGGDFGGEEGAEVDEGMDQPPGFSETKWFMIGDHLKDEEIEASDLPVEDLQEIYRRTGKLPDEVRRRYSLRYKEKKGDKE